MCSEGYTVVVLCVCLSVCLSVDAYLRTTGNEVADEGFQQYALAKMTALEIKKLGRLPTCFLTQPIIWR